MRMWIFVLRRLALLVPVIIGVMTITFALISSLPVEDQLIAHFGAPNAHDPWIYNPTLAPGQGNCPSTSKTSCPNLFYQHALSVLGLNQPIPVQWGIYIYHSLTFQWGSVDNKSYAATTDAVLQGQSVTTVLAWFLPYTLELAIFALIIILIVAIPLGNLAAVNRNRPVDQAARVMSFSGFAMPGFLLASLVLMGAVIAIGASTHYVTHTPWCPGGEVTYAEFYNSWPSALCFNNQGIYPTWMNNGVYTQPTGFPTVDAVIHGQNWLAVDTLVRMILPALVIAFGSIAILLRFVRNSMLEVMNLDFVRTARAEGIPSRTVVKRHAGRNSMNVTITVLGLTFAFFLGGFPVIEDVFHLNGVGYMLALSIQQPFDFGLIFGSTLLFTFIIVFANIIVDVLYAYLDPRVRLG
jgi:ABC-type dipeptide/oligopeptide/nickel transport system permease component